MISTGAPPEAAPLAFRYSPEQLDTWTIQVLELITRAGPIPASEVWLAFNGAIPESRVRLLLEQLVAEGRAKVERVTRRELVGGRMTRVTGRVYSAKPAKRKGAVRSRGATPKQ